MASQLFADPRNEAALKPQATSLVAASRRRISTAIGAGDYVRAPRLYRAQPGAHRCRCRTLRRPDPRPPRRATCLGFGPRFLHSTGQAYKGGPNSGVFLQITCDDAADLPVPDQKYTFGVVKAAQARGDFEVLAERGRRALRVHSRAHLDAGLDRSCPRGRTGSAVDRRSPTTENFDATRHDRPRPDGRQHRPPPDAARAHLRRLRPERQTRSRACRARAPNAARTSRDFVKAADRPPRAVWVMLPAGGHHRRDGRANSANCWPRTTSSSTAATPSSRTTSAAPTCSSRKGIHYRRCRHVSGGVWGLERGYCMMIGGEKAVVDHLDPILTTLAPGIGDDPAHPGPRRAATRAPSAAIIHCGPVGAGHFVKMVHNGIEYGVDAGLCRGLRHPAQRQFEGGCRRTGATSSTCPTSPRCGGAAA